MPEAQTPPSGECRKPKPPPVKTSAQTTPSTHTFKAHSPLHPKSTHTSSVTTPSPRYPQRISLAPKFCAFTSLQVYELANQQISKLQTLISPKKGSTITINLQLHKPLEHLHIQMKHPGNLFYRRTILIPQLTGKLQPGIHTKHP